MIYFNLNVVTCGYPSIANTFGIKLDLVGFGNSIGLNVSDASDVSKAFVL